MHVLSEEIECRQWAGASWRRRVGGQRGVNAGMWSLKRDGGTKMFVGSGRLGGPPPEAGPMVHWSLHTE